MQTEREGNEKKCTVKNEKKAVRKQVITGNTREKGQKKGREGT